MDSSVSLAQRMPCTTAFPKALGTGLLISTARPVSAELRAEMERLIDGYEHVLSRFRADSLVAHIGNAEHGGHFDFPDWPARYSICTTRCTPPRAVRSTRAWART